MARKHSLPPPLHFHVNSYSDQQLNCIGWPLWETVVCVKILLRCPENSQSAMKWILVFGEYRKQAEWDRDFFVCFVLFLLLDEKRKNMKDRGINLTICVFAAMAWFLTSHSRWWAPCHTGGRAQFPRLQVQLVVDRN